MQRVLEDMMSEHWESTKEGGGEPRDTGIYFSVYLLISLIIRVKLWALPFENNILSWLVLWTNE